MAGNIIPAIATTNAMTAGLCVLQAYKVLNGDYNRAKMVFLERSGVRAINCDNLRLPNADCPVCSVAQGKLFVDLEQATVNDLVEDVLRRKLGYGEEFSINTNVGTIYDPDLEDNLPKKLAALGVVDESFITIMDEEDEEPRVNLELRVVERPKSKSEATSVSVEVIDEIPRKHKHVAPETPTIEHVNGFSHSISNGAIGKRKRSPDETEIINGDRVKRFALASTDGDGTHPIILDETDSGAILIDDD